MFDNIPAELKDRRQFVVWKYEQPEGKEKPTKVMYNPYSGYKASVVKSETWGSFDDAVLAAASGDYSGIGYVIAEDDPYTFIDLDDTEGDEDMLAKQLKIYNAFDSYAETSPSGKGCHIIIKGSVPEGRRRSKVEVYSSHRFMTMTGHVINNRPIMERPELLQILWAEMAKNTVEFKDSNVNGDQVNSDAEVLSFARNASNGDKFNDLLIGDWQKHYSSQSEADFAFINIVAFYTQNREQVMRIFRASPMGKRDKAERDDYVVPMVNRSFDRKLPPIDVSFLQNRIEELLQANAQPEPCPQETAEHKPLKSSVPESISVPPGLVGDIARFVYGQAQRPVPEIALAAALGLMAGICGRSYNTHTTAGLNLYVLLLAPTGTGKEAIADGIDKLLDAVLKEGGNEDSKKFVGPAQIASEQAMTKYLSSTATSFVSIVGEYGLTLKQMTAHNAPPHMIGLRKMFLDLYNKSGEGKWLRPTIYSDKEKSTLAVRSPAVSIIGESTPERFYENLDESMISEGLLPRFSIIEYRGDRPGHNENPQKVPDSMLISRLTQVCRYSLMMNNNDKVIPVLQDDEATKIFKEFDRYCDERIRGAREVNRQLWNRSHVKALKVAALLAVGVNHMRPMVTAELANWAIKLSVMDAENIGQRFDRGEVGVNNYESDQHEDMRRAIMQYLKTDFEKLSAYGIEYSLHANRLVPYSYLRMRCKSMSSFKNGKLSTTQAIKATIKEMIDSGEIADLPVGDERRGNMRGGIYALLKPELFIERE